MLTTCTSPLRLLRMTARLNMPASSGSMSMPKERKIFSRRLLR